MPFKGRVPFDERGNLLHWAEPDPYDYWPDRGVCWKDAFEFEAALRFVDMRSYGHAKYMVVEDVQTGLRYSMFVRDFVDTVDRAIIDHGVIAGRWGFRKRGQEFGVEYQGA